MTNPGEASRPASSCARVSLGVRLRIAMGSSPRSRPVVHHVVRVRRKYRGASVPGQAALRLRCRVRHGSGTALARLRRGVRLSTAAWPHTVRLSTASPASCLCCEDARCEKRARCVHLDRGPGQACAEAST